ncbi:hypothetical protein FRB97_007082 [Tulasnella sp. 331]|nr:hypothetical protein FRB97_007082 [Tulasnella sp. 331]KAG8888451.1 hypothetical protein FRB98_007580 [Tulasnella sp. 332]
MPAEPTHAITATTSSRRTRSSHFGIGVPPRTSDLSMSKDDRHHPYPESSTRKASRSKGVSHIRRSSKSGKGNGTDAKEGEGEEEEEEEEEEVYHEDVSSREGVNNQPVPLVPSYYPHLASSYQPHESSPSPIDRMPPDYEEHSRILHAQLSPASALQRTIPPGSLAQLADGPDGNMARPPYPYSTLIRYAIEGSRSGRLTLAELYSAIETRFPWFLTCGNGWKNSIRHNLSLNKSFIKVARPITEPGKGSYWSINHQNPGDESSTADVVGVEPSQTSEPAQPPPPYEGKKRGRKKRDANLITGMPEPDAYLAGQRHKQMHDTIYTRYETTRAGGEAEDDGSKDAISGILDEEGREGDGQGVGYDKGDTSSHDTSAPGGSRLPTNGTGSNSRGWYEGTYRIPDPPHLEQAQNVSHQQQQATPSSPSYHVPYSIPQHVQVPEFIDDRPDRSAPRTIYNHTASSLNPIAYVHGGMLPPPLGSMTHSPSYPYPLYYSRFAVPPPNAPSMLLGSTTSSSLAAAMTMPSTSSDSGLASDLSATALATPALSTRGGQDISRSGDTGFN